MLRWSLCLLVLFAVPARAVEAHYQVYAAGLEVMDIDARFDLGPERYRVTVDFHTVGAFGFFMRSQQSTTAEGRFVQGRAVPLHLFGSGVTRGEQRVTQIDYVNGQPQVRQLLPPIAGEREPVPQAEQAGTIDPLSAMADLIREVSATGRCDGRVKTFDGRRLGVMDVRTSVVQTLQPTSRSSFAGPALRCDFVGRQTGGFMLDADRETLQRTQEGTAWFAAVVPGGLRIPVRVAFKTRWFGDATMYLVNAPLN